MISAVLEVSQLDLSTRNQVDIRNNIHTYWQDIWNKNHKNDKKTSIYRDKTNAGRRKIFPKNDSEKDRSQPNRRKIGFAENFSRNRTRKKKREKNDFAGAGAGNRFSRRQTETLPSLWPVGANAMFGVPTPWNQATEIRAAIGKSASLQSSIAHL